MVAISEVHSATVWSQTATWKSTRWSEQCLAGTLSGVSGVSEPPSVLDTCNGIEYSTPVCMAVEAELKVYVRTICNHSNSKMAIEFLRHECQQVLHPHKLRSSNASRCIKNEQNISSVVSTRAALVTSPLMDALHSLFHVKGLHWNSCIQNQHHWSVHHCELFILQGALTFRTSAHIQV